MSRRIRDIESAKKYLNKKLYLVDIDKDKPTTLYIGGINLFYNQVDYDITGFYVYEDIKCENHWGSVKMEWIKDKFEEDTNHLVFTFSYELAEQFLKSEKITEKEKERKYAIKRARELLEEQNVDYEIFG